MPQAPSSLSDPTLLQELCTTVLQRQLSDFLPFGLLERAKAYLKEPTTALSQTSEPQWQPIETAPKDGTTIIGFDPLRNMPHRDLETVEFMRCIRGEWLDPSTYTCRPTHWMPLPKGPKA